MTKELARKIPPINTTDEDPDPLVVCKYFMPDGAVERGFILVFLVALSGLSLVLGVVVCLVALLVVLLGSGEGRWFAQEIAFVGAGWAVLGWRLLSWVRQQRWHSGP